MSPNPACLALASLLLWLMSGAGVTQDLPTPHVKTRVAELILPRRVDAAVGINPIRLSFVDEPKRELIISVDRATYDKTVVGDIFYVQVDGRGNITMIAGPFKED